MAVQTQEEPLRRTFIEEEEEHFRKQNTPKKEKKPFHLTPFAVIMIALASMLCLFGGRYVRRNSTLFLEERTKEGYLAPEEFVFVDSTTGKPTQNVRSFRFADEYVYGNNGISYRTSRGIQIGARWDEFVDAYGDVHIRSAYAYPCDEEGFVDWDRDGVNVYEEMTLREFDEQYVKSGIVDPETWSIDVEFSLETDGIHLFYGEQETDAERMRFYRSPRITHPLSDYPDFCEFTLRFSFEPKSSWHEGGLEYISSDYYS